MAEFHTRRIQVRQHTPDNQPIGDARVTAELSPADWRRSPIVAEHPIINKHAEVLFAAGAGADAGYYEAQLIPSVLFRPETVNYRIVISTDRGDEQMTITMPDRDLAWHEIQEYLTLEEYRPSERSGFIARLLRAVYDDLLENLDRIWPDKAWFYRNLSEVLKPGSGTTYHYDGTQLTITDNSQTTTGPVPDPRPGPIDCANPSTAPARFSQADIVAILDACRPVTPPVLPPTTAWVARSGDPAHLLRGQISGGTNPSANPIRCAAVSDIYHYAAYSDPLRTLPVGFMEGHVSSKRLDGGVPSGSTPISWPPLALLPSEWNIDSSLRFVEITQVAVVRAGAAVGSNDTVIVYDLTSGGVAAFTWALTSQGPGGYARRSTLAQIPLATVRAFTTAPVGMCTDGFRLWLLDGRTGGAKAFTLSSGAAEPGSDLSLAQMQAARAVFAPVSMAADPTGRRLYVGEGNSADIYAFNYDGTRAADYDLSAATVNLYNTRLGRGQLRNAYNANVIAFAAATGLLYVSLDNTLTNVLARDTDISMMAFRRG